MRERNYLRESTIRRLFNLGKLYDAYAKCMDANKPCIFVKCLSEHPNTCEQWNTWNEQEREFFTNTFRELYAAKKSLIPVADGIVKRKRGGPPKFRNALQRILDA